MKRVLASLALVGLAAGAFAQDKPAGPTLTWGGYLSTGVSVVGNGTDKALIGLWDDDNWGAGARFNLDGKFAQGDSGLNFQLRADKAMNAPYLKSVYVYTNLFDKVVYTQAGIINEQSTRAGGDASLRDSFTKEKPGVVFVVKPAFDGAAVALDAGLVNLSNDGTSIQNLNEANFTVGASVAAKGLAQLKTGYLFANTTTGVAGKDATYGLGQAYVAGGLDAVPNLKLWLEGFFGGYNKGGLGGKTKTSYLGSGNEMGITILAETVKYNFADYDMAPLTVGLKSYQYLYGSDLQANAAKDAVAPSYFVTPWVSYAVDGGIVPKLAVTYFSGAEILGNSYSSTANNGKVDTVLGQGPTLVKGDVNKIALFEIKPSVQFTVGATQSITVVYAYDMSVGSDDVYFQDGFAASTAKSNHVFQLNYIYTF